MEICVKKPKFGETRMWSNLQWNVQQLFVVFFFGNFEKEIYSFFSLFVGKMNEQLLKVSTSYNKSPF